MLHGLPSTSEPKRKPSETPQTGVKETYLTPISKSTDRQTTENQEKIWGGKTKSDTRLLTK